MSPLQINLLNAVRLPARITSEPVAALIGASPHDIPILTRLGLLKPLGNPPRNGIKYYATADVLALASERRWLARVSNALNEYWRTSKRETTALRRNGTREDQKLQGRSE